MKVIKEFKASEDGCRVDTYPVGEYEKLPNKALEHALNIGAVVQTKEKKPPVRKNKDA